MANERISNGENIRLVDMESALSYPDELQILSIQIQLDIIKWQMCGLTQ